MVTNVSNYLALKHLVPYGTDDYGKIKGNIHFNVASGKERIGILKKLKTGDIYYRDDSKKGSILGTKLDYWKYKRTVLNSQSHSALVHIEAMPPVSTKEFIEIVKETKSLLEMFSGSSVDTLVLGKEKLSGNLGAKIIEELESIKKSKKMKIKQTMKNLPPTPKRNNKVLKREIKVEKIQSSKPKRKMKSVPRAPRKGAKPKKRPANVRVRKTSRGIPKPPKR